ncbi:hypothetical protein [Nocardia sp. NPDC005366]|uniref:hypothetical protein n=1 Tax=Nocardia sp. NPDC005366 TaxID=3156878 RepID=UPI0033B8B6DB
MNIDISKEQPGASEPGTEESDATAAESSASDSRASDTGAAVSGGAESPDTESDAARKDSETPASPRRAPFASTVFSAGVLVVALIAAVWFGAGWARSAWFTDGPRAAARDSALDSARQAAINMTSMKLDDVPGSLALARSSMTGAILESAQKNQQQSEQLAAQAGVGMQAKVLGASLTALNSERDKATALVVLQVTESKPDKSVSDYRYTWSLEMTKDGEVWKAEQVASLAQPVLLAGPGPSGLGQPTKQSGAEPSRAPANTPASPRPGS